MLRIQTLLVERGDQAKVARTAGINMPAMSRIVNGKEVPYPKRGRAIADAVGWPGDWQELFEEVGEEVIPR